MRILILVNVKHSITPYKNEVRVQVRCDQFSDAMLIIRIVNTTVNLLNCKSMPFNKTFTCGDMLELLVTWSPNGSETVCTLLNVTEPLICTGM